MTTWAETLGKALGMVASGILNLSEVANANFSELKALVEQGEKLMEGKEPWKFRGQMPTMPEVTVSGEGMPAGPTEKDLEALQKAMEAETNIIEEYTQKQWDIRYEAGIAEWDRMAEMNQAMFEADKEAAVMRMEMEVEIENEKNARIKQVEDTLLAMRQSMIMSTITTLVQGGIQILAASGKNQKLVFALSKAFAVGMAIIHAFLMASNAAAMTPYPASIAAYSSMLALGLYNAAAIAAVAIGQMVVGAIGAPGGSTAVSPVSPVTGLPVSPDTGFPTEGGSTLTINIEGDFIGDEAYLEMLAEKISEAVENSDVRLVASEAHYAGALI